MVELGMGTSRSVCVAVMLSGLVNFLLDQGVREKGFCRDIGYDERRKRRSGNMKLTAWVRLLVAIAALHLCSTHGADTPCDCTMFPFQPNPPCFDVCTPKYMAIASAEDLSNVFGLPNDVANTISKIAPNDRPRQLEEYKYLILGYLIGRTPPNQGVEPAVLWRQNKPLHFRNPSARLGRDNVTKSGHLCVRGNDTARLLVQKHAFFIASEPKIFVYVVRN